VQITVGKRKESYITIVLAPGQILGTSVPELNFSTAARSQVRFDVGVRSFRFEVFLVNSSMDTCHGVSIS
jgi:hypothetical protein